MIRKANENDFEAILDLSAEFWTHTCYSEPFCRDHTQAMVVTAFEHGLLAVLEVDNKVVGFVAGVKSFLLGSDQALCGTELAWWVNKENRKGGGGVALMKYIEELAKEQGIKYWAMIAMESSMPETIKQIYETLGYNKTETSYMKVL